MKNLAINKNIAILGASPKTSRYSYMAQKLLLEKGYSVLPINPNYSEIENILCYPDLKSITKEIDTITVYMKPENTEELSDDIILKKPRRVIFNPGSESDAVENKLKNNGIEVLEACTLVLLKTGQF